MAVILQTLKDTDNETIIKILVDETANANEVVFDASAALGAETDPRVVVKRVNSTWQRAKATLSWDATTPVPLLIFQGGVNYTVFSGDIPIPNNAGAGATGNIVLSNAANAFGFIILILSKVSGYEGI